MLGIRTKCLAQKTKRVFYFVIFVYVYLFYIPPKTYPIFEIHIKSIFLILVNHCHPQDDYLAYVMEMVQMLKKHGGRPVDSGDNVLKFSVNLSFFNLVSTIMSAKSFFLHGTKIKSVPRTMSRLLLKDCSIFLSSNDFFTNPVSGYYYYRY